MEREKSFFVSETQIERGVSNLKPTSWINANVTAMSESPETEHSSPELHCGDMNMRSTAKFLNRFLRNNCHYERQVLARIKEITVGHGVYMWLDSMRELAMVVDQFLRRGQSEAKKPRERNLAYF